MNDSQEKAIHVELSSNNFDELYNELSTKGVVIDVSPHNEQRERSVTVFDPDEYSIEFSQGRRGKQ